MKKSLTALLALLHISLHAATIDLDPIFAAASSNSTIRLEAGDYTISGANESGAPNPGPQLKPGVKLIGKGPGRTIVFLKVTNDVSTTAIWGLGGNLVADLTVDCGVTEPTTSYSLHKRNGIYLQPGSKLNSVNNVSVLHPYGNLSTQREGFGIIVQGTRSAITGCTVTEPRGDYVQAFSMFGSATVQNCQVFFPTQPLTSTITCFGQGGGTNVSYLNCHSRGGASGWYFDTGNIKNLRIEGCTFTDVPVGIQIRNQYYSTTTQHVSNVTIKSNTVMLQPLTDQHVGIVLNNARQDALEIPHEAGSINNVTIEGNFIGYKPSDAVPATSAGLRRAIAVVSNCTNPVPNVKGINGVTIRGNSYQTISSGEPWTHRNKWSAGAGITVTNEAAITWTTN